MSTQPSIRDQLEADAWKNHARFAQELMRKQQTRPARRPLRWEDRALLLIAVILLLLLIVRVETARAADPFFGLEFQGAAGVDRTMALDTDIRADITGLVARIEVTQIFTNTGGAWAEATYRFPLPVGATVDQLRVDVAGRILEGVIEEKKAALRQYQQARSEGKTASLLEQQRANQFQTRLTNIGAGETVSLTLGFFAPVEYQDGAFSLQIPLTFTPRWEPEPSLASNITFLESNPLAAYTGPDDHYLTLDVTLNSGLNLASIESRFHDVDIQPAPGGYRVLLADPDTRMDRVFELNWTPQLATLPAATLSTFDDGDSVYALLMLAPPLLEAIAPQPREVVFIIDTSGSMSGTSMEQARAALKMGLEHLGPDDRFNLVRFSSDSEKLFRESEPAYPDFLQQAADFIEALTADGGTVMAPALRMAMDLPQQQGLLRQIVFVTDGSVGNEQELLLQIGEDLRDSRLFTVSIGSAPNAWFMRKSAEIGRGSHTHIGHVDEVEQRIGRLWSRIENPAVQNICVDWGMDAEFYPEIIPDLYAGEPLWVYARLPAEPREITVCGELEGRNWEMQSRNVPSAGSSSLASLWARGKIEALEDSVVFGAEPDAMRREALGVALEYGLLTRYTSLVAVDKTPRRPTAEGLASGNIPSLLPAGSTLSSSFSGTATGWKTQALLAFLSLFTATGMLLYKPPSRAANTRGNRSPMTARQP
ncbi:MAG: marine proteobacterial sortase target protein [Xanthomonadales bacterium]|jgi:Ca-activated chloride channel family protein|nr:marine proteobacterial sortase target protein [Xanthomonadales bacterium]MDH4002014.1 marine proteobacterial sortase target protein [Xanthomonadales bacterium]